DGIRDATVTGVQTCALPISAAPAHTLDSKPGPRFIVTHCSLVERYGVQVAIRALDLLRDDRPDLELRVLGDGEYKNSLVELARQIGRASCRERVEIQVRRGW